MLKRLPTRLLPSLSGTTFRRLRRGIALGFLLSTLVGCAYDPFKTFDPTTASNFLSVAMDANLASYASIEVPLGDSVALITEADQTQSVELRLFPGQPLKNNGVRAELVVDFPYSELETVMTTRQMKLISPYP